MAKLLNEDKWISEVERKVNQDVLYNKEYKEIESMIRRYDYYPKVGMIVKTDAGRYWRYSNNYGGNQWMLLSYWEVFWYSLIGKIKIG